MAKKKDDASTEPDGITPLGDDSGGVAPIPAETATEPVPPAKRRFRVSVAPIPAMEVEAADEAEAIAVYKQKCGIIGSINPFACDDVDAEAATKLAEETDALIAKLKASGVDPQIIIDKLKS